MTIRHRLSLFGAVLALGLAAGGTAYAFDCIRVSSSLKGLQQSTRSGNWLLFDLSSATALKQTFADIGIPLTESQSVCMASEYASSGQPKYFALGIGVAGARRQNGTETKGGRGVLAWHNENHVTGDGRGIDHIEEQVLGALFGAAATCGVSLDEE